MQLERPRFRQDLVAELVEDGGTRFIDVLDPDSGNAFRFFEVEYSLACAMDGARDVPGIVQWAKDELGLVPSPTEVQTVIATLGQLGYLDRVDGAHAPAREPTAPARVAATPAAALAVEELSSGVVVGQQRRGPQPVAADLELGHAAHAPAPATRPSPASNIELGSGPVTGASRPAAAKPAPVEDIALGAGPVTGAAKSAAAKPAPAEDIALGTPGRVDVSTDLSEGVDIGVEDVKAAVRASQVMKAVDVPPELAAMLDSMPTTTPVPAPTPPPVVPRQRNTPPPMPAVKPPVDVKPAPKPEPVVEAKPMPAAKPEPIAPAPAAVKPLPERPVVAAKPATPVPAPAEAAPKTSRALILVLVLVALAAIGYLAYPFVMKKLAPEAPPPKPVAAAPKPVAPPPPPPVESHKLATTPEQTTEVKPTAPATIETLAPDGPVAANAVIATFGGSKPILTEVAALTKDVEKRLPDEIAAAQKVLDAATAANNKAQIASAQAHLAERQKSLADKQVKLTAAQADLAKLELVAPVAGTVAVKAKAGAHVTPTDVVFTVTQPAVRTATFAKADGATAGAHVLLVDKAEHANASCLVTSADASGAAIQCPAAAIADGAEVTYGGIDPNAAGSDASGSAAAPGAGSAAGASAGSAAPAATPPTATPAPADRGSPAGSSAAATPAAAPVAPKKAPHAHAKAKPVDAAPAAGTDPAPAPAAAPAADSTGSNG